MVNLSYIRAISGKEADDFEYFVADVDVEPAEPKKKKAVPVVEEPEDEEDDESEDEDDDENSYDEDEDDEYDEDDDDEGDDDDEDDEDDDRYDWDLEDDNRKMVILGIVLALVIVAVIGVGAYFFLNRDKGNTEQPAQTTEEQEDGNAELVIKGDGDSADDSSEAENQQTEETDSSEEETPEEEQPAEEEPAEPETVTMKVNASSVNVRSEASTDSSIVTKVANGETVEVVGDASQEWVQIRCTEQDGKEISYNNLLDINAAVDLIDEFDDLTFAILKHNNACGLASRATVLEAWKDALAGDPVSAFGGVLITNGVIDKEAAEEINKIFFEVIIAPDYDVDALEILGQKKNRIILVRKEAKLPKKQFRALLNGVLVQDKDTNIETVADLKTVTDKAPTPEEVEDMLFANKIVKNSKSNAIVLAKDKQLLASGVGQTSRVDALKQAIEKAKSFGFDLNGAVMASDAFFPFPDCVEIADKEGITAVIQPGGSVKDDLSFAYCNEHGMAMVTTGIRHFKH